MALDIFDEEIQRAALEPARWPDLLHGIARRAGALGAILITEAHRIPVPPISSNLQPLMSRYYGEGWNERDIRFRGVATALRTGAVTDADVLSPDEMARSPYYQELLRPEDCRWFCGVHFDVAGSPWFLTLQRRLRQEPFAPGEVAALKSLRRPLEAAAGLSRALSYRQVSGMADAFDHLAKPALVLDEQGLLLRCNAGAQRVLDNLAEIRHREIRFRDGANRRAFDQTLAQAGARSLWSGRPRRPTVLRTPDGRDVGLAATALGDWARYSFTQASLLVLLDETRPGPLSAEAVLRDRYGLTPAEIRLALSLAAGEPLRLAADRQRVTYQTARTHLRSIFAKTDTNRQTALVALLAGLHRPGGDARSTAMSPSE